jgi:hypothetical protein
MDEKVEATLSPTQLLQEVLATDKNILQGVNELVTLAQQLVTIAKEGRPATSATAEITKGKTTLENKAKKAAAPKPRAAADIRISDDGGTLTGTLSFLDVFGEATENVPTTLTPSYQIVDVNGNPVTGAVTLTPTSTGNGGYGCTGSVVSPPPSPLPTDLQLQLQFTIPSGLENQAVPEVGLASPAFDLVPGEAGSAVMAVSTP